MARVTQASRFSLRGWHPCLICSTRTAGAKGKVVCGECRRKVTAYDREHGREATVDLQPVVAHLPNLELLVPHVSSHESRLLGRQLASLWIHFPTATDNERHLNQVRVEHEVPDASREYLQSFAKRPTITRPVPRLVPKIFAQTFVRLEWIIHRLANVAFAEGVQEGLRQAGALASHEARILAKDGSHASTHDDASRRAA